MGNTKAGWTSDFIKPLRIPPGTKVRLTADFDPAWSGGLHSKKDGKDLLARGVDLIADCQQRLAAQETHGVVVILQGIDAAGKDGMVRHVLSGMNPQGVSVSAFKVPSAEELRHDYLWRYAQRLPARGQIAIFNRSHYEEVLVVRVHPENLDRQQLPEGARRPGIWRRRYQEINNWERHLDRNGFRVVKLFLNLSKEEQRQRFLQRIERRDKNWKFSASDVAEREYWDDYQRAFSRMLSHTSTPWAPWYVIPADHKWFARISAAAVIAHTLTGIGPRYPEPDAEEQQHLQAARVQLEAEAPR
jgi:PPK2 family polyphosphate:nucleotide phosphotransferase